MKYFFSIIVIIVFCLLISCTLQSNNQMCAPNNTTVLEEAEYYRITKADEHAVKYEIFNISGIVVLSETTDRPLRITMINDNVIDISIGMGTGITIHRYYEVNKDVFSDEFSYVLDSMNDLVAYIDIPPKSSFKDRKIVVQNIFNKKSFFKEFTFDFSNIDTPVVEAEFLESGSLLQLTYLSGEEQAQVSTVINLNL